MSQPTPRAPHARMLKGVALLTLMLGLLCLFHGVGQDDAAGGLCPVTVLVPIALVLGPDQYLAWRVRPAPALAFYAATLRLPDPPPKIRPA